jgi:hypothetical protein
VERSWSRADATDGNGRQRRCRRIGRCQRALPVGSPGGAWRRADVADWRWFPPAAASNRVEARLALAPPTPPGMRVRTGRFAQHSRTAVANGGPCRAHGSGAVALAGRSAAGGFNRFSTSRLRSPAGHGFHLGDSRRRVRRSKMPMLEFVHGAVPRDLQRQLRPRAQDE